MKGLKEIDIERADILSKVISKWTLPFVIPLDIEVPKDMLEQLRVNLPLLDRQVYRLDMMIRQYHKDKYPNKTNAKKVQPFIQKSLVTNVTAAAPDLSKVDIKYILGKLKFFQISGEEAKQLYYFIKQKSEELESHGYKMAEIKSMTTRALGKIGNSNIRKWLVEIEDI
jgi:hypothetical protein